MCKLNKLRNNSKKLKHGKTDYVRFLATIATIGVGTTETSASEGCPSAVETQPYAEMRNDCTHKSQKRLLYLFINQFKAFHAWNYCQSDPIRPILEM